MLGCLARAEYQPLRRPAGAPSPSAATRETRGRTGSAWAGAAGPARAGAWGHFPALLNDYGLEGDGCAVFDGGGLMEARAHQCFSLIVP
jgi:hypothetical protein